MDSIKNLSSISSIGASASASNKPSRQGLVQRSLVNSPEYSSTLEKTVYRDKMGVSELREVQPGRIKSLATNQSITYGKPAELNITSSFSLAIKAKTDSISGLQSLISRFLNSGNERAYTMFLGNSLRLFLYAEGINASQIIGDTNINAGQMYSFGAKFDADNQEVKLFIDGVEETVTIFGQPVPTSVISTTNAETEVGAINLGTSNRFSGGVWDMRIYDELIPDSEFLAIHENRSTIRPLLRDHGQDNNPNQSYTVGTLDVVGTVVNPTSGVASTDPDVTYSYANEDGYSKGAGGAIIPLVSPTEDALGNTPDYTGRCQYPLVVGGSNMITLNGINQKIETGIEPPSTFSVTFKCILNSLDADSTFLGNGTNGLNGWMDADGAGKGRRFDLGGANVVGSDADNDAKLGVEQCVTFSVEDNGDGTSTGRVFVDKTITKEQTFPTQSYVGTTMEFGAFNSTSRNFNGGVYDIRAAGKAISHEEHVALCDYIPLPASDMEIESEFPNTYAITGITSVLAGYDFVGEDRAAVGLLFNDDGTKAYLLGNSNNDITQYSLATPYVVTSGVTLDGTGAVGVELQPRGFCFNDDGTKVYIIGDAQKAVSQFSLATPYIVTSGVTYDGEYQVSTQDNKPVGVAFSADGLTMIIGGAANDALYQYTLGTAFDVTGTVTYVDSYDISGETTSAYNILIDDSGSKLYVAGSSDGSIHEYVLGTPYDITGTVTYQGALDVSAYEIFPTGMCFNGDGSKFYFVGDAADIMFEATVPPVRFERIGTHLPCAEGDQATVYDVSGNGLDCTIVNYSSSARGTTQNNYHYNLVYGFTEGYNYIPNSQDFSASNWNAANGVTVSTNVAAAPDGTLSADKVIATATNELHILREVTLDLGTPGEKTISIFVKEADYTECSIVMFNSTDFTWARVDFDFTTGVATPLQGATNATSESLADGRYRVSITGTCTISSNQILLYPGVLAPFLGDGVSGTLFWGGQAVDGPTQLPYQRTTSDSIYQVKLPAVITDSQTDVTEQTENQILRSESLDNPYWNQLSATVTADQAVAPDGQYTADLIVADSGIYNRILRNNIVLPSHTPGDVVGVSCFFKVRDVGEFAIDIFGSNSGLVGYAYFDVATDSFRFGGVSGSTRGFKKLSNDRYRIWVYGPGNDTEFGINLYPTGSQNSSGTDGNYARGAQMQSGVTTAYIPTAGEARTGEVVVTYASGSRDALGNTITNPPVSGHNGSESTVEQATSAPALVAIDDQLTTDYMLDSTDDYAPIPLTYADLPDNNIQNADLIRGRKQGTTQADRRLAYDEPVTGSAKNKADKYTTA